MTENDTFAFDPEGNAASALGFFAVGVHAGFRADPERLDMALVVADEPCAAAATFTTNVFCAAPVRVSREHLNEGGAVVIHDCLPDCEATQSEDHPNGS